MSHRRLPAAFLAMAAFTAACHKQKPVTAPTPTTTTTTSPTIPNSPPAPPPTVTPRPENTGPSAAEIERMRAAAVATITATIYFDYDKSDLRDDARSTLDSKVPVLRANPAVRIKIAGHTDERGSAEYNIALGQRRAAAAQRYLTGLGIDAGRIEIVSFGEERPARMGEGEEAWSKNRRDEFEVTAGADQIRGARQ
ncbi:MAG TPA: peptidoglycan-associated lipoprotein Pal [Gemmatimonadaceae bacterium]|nr:peptidoglycan-associated lipoprotein Pal [Gemmatimonadaceae bacterium]